MSLSQPKPDWLRVSLPRGEQFNRLKQLFERLELNTVCHHAHCPNMAECWCSGTATLMLLGPTCTRSCRFCSVNSGHPQGVIDPDEPQKVAEAVAQMDLTYVVITMVDRDDLLDGGAEHMAKTLTHIRENSPQVRVEVLVGDFAGSRRDIETVVNIGRPDVFAHNVEVVPSLQHALRDARCSWERSIQTLHQARQAGAKLIKSSLMLGCGETEQEIEIALRELRTAGVDIITIGQYLRPTKKQVAVSRYVHPDQFRQYQQRAQQIGFTYVASGPLVRSSYRAAQAFIDSISIHEAPDLRR